MMTTYSINWKKFTESEPDKFESYLVVDVVNGEEIHYVGTPYLDVSKHTRWSTIGNKDPFLDANQKWVSITDLKELVK